MSVRAEEVQLDFGRRARIGLDEAVLCETKTVEQLAYILDQAAEARRSMLLTRLPDSQYRSLRDDHRAALDYHALSQTAYFGEVPAPEGDPRVAIVFAGTSDAGVAQEAARTLRFAGVASELHGDVGVAGLWRLLDRVDQLATMDVVIAVAGMDAAMVSVLGGLVPGLLIAVPTAVGYGSARHGETALHSCLTSCSPGIVVVNIGNGFGAACAALRATGRARAMQTEAAGARDAH